MNALEREEAWAWSGLLKQLTAQGDLLAVARAMLDHYGGAILATRITGLKLGVFRHDQNAAYLERHREAITAAADQCADEVLSQLIGIMRGER